MGSTTRAAAAMGIAALALSACSGWESGPRSGRAAAPAAAPGELAAAHEAFLDALRSADADAAVAQLDSSAELVLFPMEGAARLEQSTEAALGLEAMFRAIGPAEWTVVHVRPVVRGTSAWVILIGCSTLLIRHLSGYTDTGPPSPSEKAGPRQASPGARGSRRTAGRSGRRGSGYSSTWMFFFSQMSLSCFGHTVTLTSPRCALRRRSMTVRL